MSDTGKRIQQRRKELHLSADYLADNLGVSRSTIFRYEKGDIEKVPAMLLDKIASLLQTTPGFLMGWEDEPQPHDLSALLKKYKGVLHPIEKRAFPMLGTIACGQPIMAEQKYESYVMADADINADYCLTAHGDSMINARIFDGDLIFIKKQDAVSNGDIAAVCIDDDVTLKRVYYYPDRQEIRLQAENPQYAAMVYSGEELDHIHILGKAVFFQSLVR